MTVKFDPHVIAIVHFFSTLYAGYSAQNGHHHLTLSDNRRWLSDVIAISKSLQQGNNQLASADRLSDKVMVVAILCKLPKQFHEFVKIAIHSDNLPSFEQLIKSLEDDATITELRGRTSRLDAPSRTQP